MLAYEWNISHRNGNNLPYAATPPPEKGHKYLLITRVVCNTQKKFL
jgi:hypothetical protein